MIELGDDTIPLITCAKSSHFTFFQIILEDTGWKLKMATITLPIGSMQKLAKVGRTKILSV